MVFQLGCYTKVCVCVGQTWISLGFVVPMNFPHSDTKSADIWMTVFLIIQTIENYPWRCFFCTSLLKAEREQTTCSTSGGTPSRSQGLSPAHSKHGIILATRLSAPGDFSCFLLQLALLWLFIVSLHNQWLIFPKYPSMWSPTQKMWLILQCCLKGVGHDIQALSVRDCGQLLGREDALGRRSCWGHHALQGCGRP